MTSTPIREYISDLSEEQLKFAKNEIEQKLQTLREQKKYTVHVVESEGFAIACFRKLEELIEFIKSTAFSEHLKSLKNKRFSAYQEYYTKTDFEDDDYFGVWL